MDTTIETFEHAGLTVKIGQEEDASFANPRENDDGILGTIVAWHPDYVLGDYQLRDGGGHGAVEAIFKTARGRSDFRNMEALYRYLRIAQRAPVVLPLYLYDHSGISISAGAPNPFDNPRVQTDHHGQRLGWDTSMVGYIFTTPERVRELCGDCPACRDKSPGILTPCSRCEDMRLYRPDDFAGTAREWIERDLRAEIEVYDQFLRGEVYYYIVLGREGEVLDSCGGYLGGDGERDAFEFVKYEAEQAAEACAREIRADEEPDIEVAAYAAAR